MCQAIKKCLKKKQKHSNCKIRSHFLDHFICTDQFLHVVYLFKYKIALTLSKLPDRSNAATTNSSLKFKNYKKCFFSALYPRPHFPSIDETVSQWWTPVETRLAETRAIGFQTSTLNRKIEIVCESQRSCLSPTSPCLP